jgi:hypothetical protein
MPVIFLDFQFENDKMRPLHNLPRIVLLMISENGCWECEKNDGQNRREIRSARKSSRKGHVTPVAKAV